MGTMLPRKFIMPCLTVVISNHLGYKRDLDCTCAVGKHVTFEEVQREWFMLCDHSSNPRKLAREGVHNVHGFVSRHALMFRHPVFVWPGDDESAMVTYMVNDVPLYQKGVIPF